MPASPATPVASAAPAPQIPVRARPAKGPSVDSGAGSRSSAGPGAAPRAPAPPRLSIGRIEITVLEPPQTSRPEAASSSSGSSPSASSSFARRRYLRSF
ncbi:MAG: hypothetical protein AAGD01_10870 [Acidobacteriota bacterium]